MKKAHRRRETVLLETNFSMHCKFSIFSNNGSVALRPGQAQSRQINRQPLKRHSLVRSYKSWYCSQTVYNHIRTAAGCCSGCGHVMREQPLPASACTGTRPAHVPYSASLAVLGSICCSSAALRVARRRALLAGVRIVVARLHCHDRTLISSDFDEGVTAEGRAEQQLAPAAGHNAQTEHVCGRDLAVHAANGSLQKPGICR